MQSVNKTLLKELQYFIREMELETIRTTVLPMFEMSWKKVLHCVVVTKQPVNADSVARVICKMAAITMPPAKLDDILALLRFIVVANNTRTWHVVRLFHKPAAATEKPPLLITALNLPHRVMNIIPYKTEVESVLIEEMLHWTIRIAKRTGDCVVNCCAPPGEPIALFSSTSDHTILQSCVQALGYDSFVEAKLHGDNIPSLVRQACDDKPAEFVESDTKEKPVLAKPVPATLCKIKEESLRDVEGTASHCPGDTKEKPALAKPVPATLCKIKEESLRVVEGTASHCPGPNGDLALVERRTDGGRIDKSLLNTINLTIDSD